MLKDCYAELEVRLNPKFYPDFHKIRLYYEMTIAYKFSPYFAYVQKYHERKTFQILFIIPLKKKMGEKN